MQDHISPKIIKSTGLYHMITSIILYCKSHIMFPNLGNMVETYWCGAKINLHRYRYHLFYAVII